jgi:hypothetical protein
MLVAYSTVHITAVTRPFDGSPLKSARLLNEDLWQLSQCSVWLQTGQAGFDPRQRQNNFSSSLCVQSSFEAHPASCTMGTGGHFPGGKVRPGRDADHSPLSSAEVKNE